MGLPCPLQRKRSVIRVRDQHGPRSDEGEQLPMIQSRGQGRHQGARAPPAGFERGSDARGTRRSRRRPQRARGRRFPQGKARECRPRLAGRAQSSRVDLRHLREVVQRAETVPGTPAGQTLSMSRQRRASSAICSGPARHRLLAAVRVHVHPALALPHRSVCQNDEALPHQPLAERLAGGMDLPFHRRAAEEEDAGQRLR